MFAVVHAWRLRTISAGQSWVVLLGFALALIVMAFPADAASFAGNCITNATEYRVTDTNKSTTSTTFVAVPQSGIQFAQGGSASGCVIVTFTAVLTVDNAWMYVKATLDGKNPLDPEAGVWRVIAQESRTAVFVFRNVAPGSHTIVMKFRSSNGGNVTVYNRTTTVSYRK
jgi:hypothetical protein